MYAQDSLLKPMRFYHANGKVSSEGFIREGKPDAYWKTYNENGQLKSEGNRLNFELDGIWKFYSDSGNLILEIQYREGKKSGLRKSFGEEEDAEENFVNDSKQGISTFYYKNRNVKRTVEYIDGLEHGISREYTENGRLIKISEYRRGFLVNEEFINRYDPQGRKNGVWKEFYENGNLKTEITYRNDLKNGYQKEYDIEGKLLKVEKYINGDIVLDAKEVASYEIRYDYYPDGSVKVMGSYLDNVAQGVRKEFGPDGSIVKSYILSEGFVVGEGLLDAKNRKQGHWKEYYESGQLQAEGDYKDDIRIGEWKFYHPNGKLEQHGRFLPNGKAEGNWKWYYSSGLLRREESYENGLESGNMKEYAESGEIMIEGAYNLGMKEGKWLLNINGYTEEGEYINDIKEGLWKSFYEPGIPHSEGSYVDGLPDGIHKRYWENGILYEEGKYQMGIKEGEWNYFNREGKKYLSIIYKNGIERSYNNMLISPDLPDDNL